MESYICGIPPTPHYNVSWERCPSTGKAFHPDPLLKFKDFQPFLVHHYYILRKWHMPPRPEIGAEMQILVLFKFVEKTAIHGAGSLKMRELAQAPEARNRCGFAGFV